MHEYVLFAGLLYKAIAFRVVKPFDHSYSFRHVLLIPPTYFN
jgi:hypothetical protein